MDPKLPDFDVMIKLTQDIGRLKTSISMYKALLDDLLARITYTVMTNEVYWINKKQPSMDFTKTTFHARGYDEETYAQLKRYRQQIGDDEGLLREKELLFQVYRDMIDVWRTESANKRGATWEGV